MRVIAALSIHIALGVAMLFLVAAAIWLGWHLVVDLGWHATWGIVPVGLLLPPAYLLQRAYYRSRGIDGLD